MSGYIGASPVPQATQHRQAFTATASQTSFATAGFTPQFVDVYLNGIKLAAEDYVAENGSDIVLTTGAALDDILEYVAYTPFEVASQTFTGTTTVDALAATSVSAGTLVAGRATYGGTANAITITTGLGLTALVAGMEIRFRATATNTGNTTINVDGIGAATAWTVKGTELPADYILTGQDTVSIYNGLRWVTSRAVESGTNANGEWTRWEDGTQRCSFGKLALGTIGTSAIQYWTYPISFVSGQTPANQIQAGPSFSSSLSVFDVTKDIGSSSNTQNRTRYRVINTGSSTGGYSTGLALGQWY